MIRRYGIDTSVLVRLLTGRPRDRFAHTVRRLTALASDGTTVVASNQVIGEAYVALQHHFGVQKPAARSALIQVLGSGLVAPLNGLSVVRLLDASGGAGLLDRLIADDYARSDLDTLTLDKAMASLPRARFLDP